MPRPIAASPVVLPAIALITTLSITLIAARPAGADEPLAAWRDRLTFFASFDQSTDADVAAGDRRLYTAADLSRQAVTPGLTRDAVVRGPNGRWGHCLSFQDTTDSVVIYRGEHNVPYRSDEFSMTISFWMSLSPDEDLKPGFVDPLQITEKQWNDAAIFVDFSKDERPRHFRLGAFSDLAAWNPQNTPWEQIPDTERPMVTVKQTPFDRSRWTHVVITLDRFNSKDQLANASLFLDGVHQGTLTKSQQFTWQPERTAIMLGIKYIGGIDDFAIFSGSMSADEVKLLMQLPKGVASLR